MDESRCKHCWKTKEEHCKFESVVRQEDCVCDLNDWTEQPPKVCDKYIASTAKDFEHICSVCEHEEDCHKKE